MDTCCTAGLYIRTVSAAAYPTEDPDLAVWSPEIVKPPSGPLTAGHASVKLLNRGCVCMHPTQTDWYYVTHPYMRALCITTR
jgi:hypothetical protein